MILLVAFFGLHYTPVSVTARQGNKDIKGMVILAGLDRNSKSVSTAKLIIHYQKPNTRHKHQTLNTPTAIHHVSFPSNSVRQRLVVVYAFVPPP